MRRGEVECKPTPVALSADSLKRSSTGESDGYSDYENSASYDDTDGDTDGEKLVTNQQVPASIDNVGSFSQGAPKPMFNCPGQVEMLFGHENL